MIKVQDLTKFYGPTLAVDGISFEVERGEVVGFLGPNGAGKTTTMRMVTCYLRPTSGKVDVAGYNIYDSPLEVRRRIGYLPESCPLYPEMNVVDYLEYIAELRQLPASTRRRRIGEMVETTGLEGQLHKDIGELSKGYRQRVGLAQAMVHDPDILILDEPTSGLDPNQIVEIRQLIREIGRQKTIILSTHILPEVSATCDRVLIINDARMVASGTTEELIDSTQGGDVVTVSVQADEDALYEELRKAEFIGEFRKIAEETVNGRPWYTVEVRSEETHIGERLFRLVVDRGWSLRELRTEKMSLEEVFAKLTTT